jgi:uncharacterized protein with HEPN domain
MDRGQVIEILRRYDAASMTLDAFKRDPIVRRAAAYAIQTISAAVRQIPDDWLADYPTEPWARIKGNAMSISVSTMRFCGRSSPWTHKL